MFVLNCFPYSYFNRKIYGCQDFAVIFTAKYIYGYFCNQIKRNKKWIEADAKAIGTGVEYNGRQRVFLGEWEKSAVHWNDKATVQNAWSDKWLLAGVRGRGGNQNIIYGGRRRFFKPTPLLALRNYCLLAIAFCECYNISVNGGVTLFCSAVE